MFLAREDATTPADSTGHRVVSCREITNYQALHLGARGLHLLKRLAQLELP